MRIIKQLVSYILLLMSLLGFGHSVSAETKPAPLRIGAISILSGEGAAWGTNQQRGTLLAVEEINKSGGIGGRRLEVVYEDSPNGTARNAVSAYRQLVSLKGMKFILGPSAASGK